MMLKKTKPSAEKTVRDIRRATRNHDTVSREMKLDIWLSDLRHGFAHQFNSLL